MQFAGVNGVTLHFQLLSAARGKPLIVFINSLGTDFRIWRDVIVDLAGRASMICYDKRGHGLSSTGVAPYTMDDHVGDLIALLEHVGVSGAILCGVSVGGMIAQGVYARRPDLVSALVLCDTRLKIGGEAMWNDRITRVTEDGIAALVDPILERWFSPEFRQTRSEELEGYRNMLVRQPVEGYAGTCAAIRDADFTEAAGRIAVPALCLVGDQDGSTPPQLVGELAALIPGADFEVIAGAGHLPSIEQPGALSARIVKFILEHGLSNAPADNDNRGALH